VDSPEQPWKCSSEVQFGNHEDLSTVIQIMLVLESTVWLAHKTSCSENDVKKAKTNWSSVNAMKLKRYSIGWRLQLNTKPSVKHKKKTEKKIGSKSAQTINHIQNNYLYNTDDGDVDQATHEELRDIHVNKWDTLMGEKSKWRRSGVFSL